jgi:hypothetical protein
MALNALSFGLPMNTLSLGLPMTVGSLEKYGALIRGFGTVAYLFGETLSQSCWMQTLK